VSGVSGVIGVMATDFESGAVTRRGIAVCCVLCAACVSWPAFHHTKSYHVPMCVCVLFSFVLY